MSRVALLGGSTRAVAEGKICKLFEIYRTNGLVPGLATARAGLPVANRSSSSASSRSFSAQAPVGLPTTPGGTSESSWKYWQKLLAAAAVPVGATVLLRSGNDGMEQDEPVMPTIEDYYILQNKTLGSGQFGMVRTAVDRATGEVVAVKCVPRCKATEAHFEEEIEAHRQAGIHPNIVGLKGVFAAEDCWYIVLELASGGELYECLTTEGALEKWEVRGLLREMAGAVAHIHSRGVVHGDIKPENLLLREPPKKRKGMAMESEGGYGYGGPEKVQKVSGVSAAPVAEDLTYSTGVSRCSSGNNIGETAEKWEGRETASTSGKVLLADFGSSFRVNAGEGGGERDGVREGPRAAKEYTAAYSAPEVVSEGSLDQKADVWSLGVIAYVMVKGHHPFDPTSEADEEEIVENVVHSEPDWTGLDPQAAALIRKMLSRDPNDRPSALEVCESSWLQVTDHAHRC